MASSFVKGKAYFDGVNGRLTLADSADWDFGSGNFTAEAIFTLDSISSTLYQHIIMQRGSFNSNYAYGIQFTTTSDGNCPRFVYTLDGSTALGFSFTDLPLTASTKYNIVIQRTGTKIECYLNGVKSSLFLNISTSSLYNSSAVMVVGSTNNNGFLFGFLFGLKVTKGLARYTTNFTAPTEFTNDANTVLCMNFVEPIGSTTFIDETGKTVTTVGNVVIVV